MTREDLVYNAFLDDLRDDWIAVAANGHPIARASDEVSVRRAAPDAAHYFNAAMLADRFKEPDNAEEIKGEVGNEFPAAEEPNPVAAGLDAVKAQSAFDHDGDGAEGGSEKGEASTAHKGAVKRAAAKAKK